jgi:hypothetical protein
MAERWLLLTAPGLLTLFTSTSWSALTAAVGIAVFIGLKRDGAMGAALLGLWATAVLLVVTFAWTVVREGATFAALSRLVAVVRRSLCPLESC